MLFIIRFIIIITILPFLLSSAFAERQISPDACEGLHLRKERADRIKHIRLCIAALKVIYSAEQSIWPAAHLAKNIEYLPLTPLPKPLYLPENPHSETKEKLGKEIFSDPVISKSGQISCASCHLKELGFSDGVRTSFGHNRQRGTRNSPSIVNVGLYNEFFWDGRTKSLLDQALAALTNPIEMAADPDESVAKLSKNKNYAKLFKEIYGDDEITIERMLQVISVYVRSENKRTKFDRFMEGKRKSLNSQEIWGLHLFRTKAKCMNCHQGAFMTDQKYHNLGLHFYGRKYEDLGRYNVTGKNKDVGAFRTSTLRNISRTAPYMHTGQFKKLDFIINIYNAGGFHPKPKKGVTYDPPFPKTSVLLEKLHLTREEKTALKAFLMSL